MTEQEGISLELKGALDELESLLKEYPQNTYFQTLRKSLEAVSSDIRARWPLDKQEVEQLRGMGAYVARQLDYPEPGEQQYTFWLRLARISELMKE